MYIYIYIWIYGIGIQLKHPHTTYLHILNKYPFATSKNIHVILIPSVILARLRMATFGQRRSILIFYLQVYFAHTFLRFVCMHTYIFEIHIQTIYIQRGHEHTHTWNWSEFNTNMISLLYSLKVPCTPKWFDSEFPIIKTTKLLSRNSLMQMSNANLTIAVK